MTFPASIKGLWALCKSINGRTEHPANSNRIFVWVQLIKAKIAQAWVLGQPYCAGGREWLLWKLKINRPDVANPWYCPSRLQWARSHDRYRSIRRGQAGDEVYFAFTASAQRSGLAEHIGTLMADVKAGDTTIRTFEFNTSSGTGGSQDNGGGCYFRTRPIDSTVLGVMFYADHFGPQHKTKKTPPTTAKAPARKVKRNPFAKALRAAGVLRQGDTGEAVRAVQWAVGVPVDGQFGPDTDHAVRHFQRYHTDRDGNGLIPDGEVGRLTRQQLLTVTHHQH